MATLDKRDEAEETLTDTSGADKGSDDSIEIKPRGSSANGILGRPLGWISQVRNFWHEIALEMRKVSWPARSEVASTTVIVIVAVFFFAAYLFAADILFTYIIEGLEWGASKLFG
ncbi:MAG: preprotein translocase subunit SecE [Acidobacteria bacterium]|nr:preprotein translocase subunit SecE [Acidobacteriota bacterium]